MTNKKYHIFVSYSRTNKDIKDQIVKDLTEYGFIVWVDTESITLTKNWTEEIKRGIIRSKILLYLGSPEAKESTYVSYELGYADALGKIILPIRVKGHTWADCLPSWYSLRQGIELRGSQYDKRKFKFFDEICKLISTKVHHDLIVADLISSEINLLELLDAMTKAIGTDSSSMFSQYKNETWRTFGYSKSIIRNKNVMLKIGEILKDWGLLKLTDKSQDDFVGIGYDLTKIGQKLIGK